MTTATPPTEPDEVVLPTDVLEDVNTGVDFNQPRYVLIQFTPSADGEGDEANITFEGIPGGDADRIEILEAVVAGLKEATSA